MVIDAQGYAKLTDFGLSKEGVTDNFSARTMCGTPEYLAPEVLSRSGHGKAADWWSLGTLIFEMLTGLPPFYSRNSLELYDCIKNGEVDFPDWLRGEARDLISQLLRKDPSQRLGGGPGDSEELKQHEWFADIDWDSLFHRQLEPPFTPVLSHELDVTFFDRVRTRQNFTHLPADDSAKGEMRAHSPTSPFQGFSYTEMHLDVNEH